MTDEERVRFDFEVDFLNGGGLRGDGFRLDIDGDDTDDGARPAHTALLAAGIPIVEHLSGLEQLPPGGLRFSAVPAPVRGMGTFPVRAFAVIGP